MGDKKTKRVCQSCGKTFYGAKDNFYCDKCAALLKRRTVTKTRVCQDCGKEFAGGPRAKRCPTCAAIARADYKQKQTERPLGSIDRCAWCSREYVVKAGRQKYCSKECQHEAVKAWQREHKKGYAQKSGQDAKKDKRRKSVKKVCVYCQRVFASDRSTNLCSAYCRGEQKKLAQCKSDIKRGYKRDLEKYIRKRDAYREAVKNASQE